MELLRTRFNGYQVELEHNYFWQELFHVFKVKKIMKKKNYSSGIRFIYLRSVTPFNNQQSLWWAQKLFVMCCSLVGKNHVCYDCIYRDFPQTAQPTLYALITLAFFIPPLSVDRSLPYDFTVLCSPKCLLLFLKFLVSCLISLCKKILVRTPGMFLGSLMNVCFLS